MSNQRTPGPYKYARAFGNNAPDYFIVHDGSSAFRSAVVATTDSEANAEFIIRACNAHDDLVLALGDMLNNFGGNDHETPFIVAARAALAKARACNS